MKSYQALQTDQGVDEQTLTQVINEISTRKFKKAAMQIPTAFGIQKSSISRKFIRATAKQLKAFQERDLSQHDIIVVFMDGKIFAENEMIIALGVTLSGEKIVLGTIESSTENGRVCRDFIRQLKERGLQSDKMILFVIDESKGLSKEPRPSGRGFLKQESVLPPLCSGQPFIPALPRGAFWQVS